MVDNSSIYVVTMQDTIKLDYNSVVNCCLEKIRQGYDILVGNFSYDGTDFYRLFKFCCENNMPILFIDKKYSDNIENIDIFTIKKSLENYDFLYTENFDVVMINEKACHYVKDNFDSQVLQKSYLNVMEELIKRLDKKSLNSEKIIL